MTIDALAKKVLRHGGEVRGGGQAKSQPSRVEFHVAAVWGPARFEERGQGGAGSENGGDLLTDIGFDEVAGLDVLEGLEADSAVEARAHLGGIVLEAAQ